MKASPAGLEPATSCLTSRRALLAAPRGRSPGQTRTVDLRRVEALPSLLGHGTCFTRGGGRETRTHKRLAPPPVFKTGSSSGRMTSVCLKFRGLESNQWLPATMLRTVPGARRYYQQQLPRIMYSWDTAIATEVRGEGLEPPSPGSKPGSLPLADPRSLKECPARVEPGTDAQRWSRQLGRLEPLPLGQGHVKAEGGRVELPRHCCSTAFEAAAIARWLAVPFSS